MCRSISEGGRRCPHDEDVDVRRARQRAAYQAKRATPTGAPPSAGTLSGNTAAAVSAASESLRLARQTGLRSDAYKAAEQACVDAGAAIDTAAWTATVANPELRGRITDRLGAGAAASAEAFHAAFDAAHRQARLDQADAWAAYAAADPADQDAAGAKVRETRESAAHLNNLRTEVRGAIREATLAELAAASGGLGAQLPAGTVVSKQLRDVTATTLASMPSTLTEAFAAHPSELRIESSPHRGHYQSNARRQQAAGWQEPHLWQSTSHGDTAEEAIANAQRFNKKHNRANRTADYTAEPNGRGGWHVTCQMACRVYETKRFSKIRARTVSSLTHELVHRAEHGDPTLGRLQHAHLTARVGDTAADYPSVRLAAGEWAVDDHFADPYSGRRYGDNTTHFEVLSTGVQQVLPENGSGCLFGDQHDPRLRRFTLGWLAAYQPPTQENPT